MERALVAANLMINGELARSTGANREREPPRALTKRFASAASAFPDANFLINRRDGRGEHPRCVDQEVCVSGKHVPGRKLRDDGRGVSLRERLIKRFASAARTFPDANSLINRGDGRGVSLRER
ncbi:hypothetical protein GCM10010169_43490 [Micromonospora fulviviridis]|nr:hypothetical protein GCM10010169_43490 [Micromonospora fulviviridis]